MSPRDFSLGASGDDVKAIQDALNIQPDLTGDALNADGVFGPLTAEKVRAYQSAHGLAVDGVVGAKTRQALFPYGVATIMLFGIPLSSAAYGSLNRRIPRPSAGNGLRSLAMRGAPTPLNPADMAGLHVDWDSIISYLESNLAQSPPAYVSTRIPGADSLLPTPDLLQVALPLFDCEYDHLEIVPGGQANIPFHMRQSAYTLTVQAICQKRSRRRPQSDPYDGRATWRSRSPYPIRRAETLYGVPFFQFTDVDYLHGTGKFHYWQPYAQLGVQDTFPGAPHPSLSGGLFPINLGLDLGDRVTVSLAGGVVANLDLWSGQVTVPLQLTFGVSVKFGKAK